VPPPAFDRPLVIPAQLHGATGPDGVCHHRLRLAPGRSELVTGVHTATWRTTGHLGPTLRIARGKRVDIYVHTTTGPQVYAGLAGMLIVDDDAAESSRLLPHTYGVR